jgi:hypothetical protein
MRKIYSSGADQVLAKPPPKLFVTVSVSELILIDLMLNLSGPCIVACAYARVQGH